MKLLYMNISLFNDEELFEKGMSLISANRKEKIHKLNNPVTARLSLGAGVLLHIVMKEEGHLDLYEQIKYGVHGKPYLEDDPFYFNLSHSGEYVICAYDDKPMGADIQLKKNKIPSRLNKILSEQEMQQYSILTEKEQKEFFYKIWTRKESLIKCDGRGLRIPLYEISMIDNDISFEGKRIYSKDLNILQPQYSISLSSEKEIIMEEIREITSNFLTNY